MLTRKLTVTNYIKLCPSMSIHRSWTKTKDGATSGWDMVLRTGSSMFYALVTSKFKTRIISGVFSHFSQGCQVGGF